MLVAAGTAAEAADAGRKSLVLEAVGRISPRCDIGALGGVDFGDLRRSGLGGAATGDFTSRQLQAGQVISSRGGVAFDGGRLNIEMMEPEGAGLLAGRYWETVEISLVPRL